MKFHHVGVICPPKFMDQFVPLAKLLGIPPGPHADVPEFNCYCYMYGDIELVVPYGGKLLDWLREVGTHIHHIALETDDIRKTCDELRKAGYTIVTDEPVKGVNNTLVNFIHPEQTGIMVELVECLKLD